MKAYWTLPAKCSPFDQYDLFQSRTFMRLSKNYHVPIDPLEDKQLRLADEMSLVRTHFNALGRPYAGRKWRELANELANLQAAARNAEWVLNEIMFPKLEVTLPEEEERE